MTFNFADSNRSILRYIPEAQWGSTPSSGNSRVLRMTSHTLATKKNTTVSNEIRDDRMVSQIIETEMMSDGGINFEFSAGSFDDLFQAFVLGTWTKPMTWDFWEGNIVSWTSTSVLTVTGLDLTGYLVTGRRLKTEGFVNPNNNDFWTISSTAFSGGNTAITMSQTTATIEAGTAHAKVLDANDVIVLKNTSMQSTSGTSSFGATGAFTSAIAAGALNAGQKIHVHGLGREKGTVAFAAVAVVATTVTVNDGVNSYIFVAGTDFAIGAAQADSATNLAAAINAARVVGVGASPGVAATFLNVKATVATATVTVTNLNITGGTLTKFEPAAGTNVTLVNFAGGDASQSGVFTIVALTNDLLTVSPTPTTNTNSGSLAVTIRGSMLRNPGVATNITPQSFTLEAGFEDVSKTFTQDGLRVQDFTLDVNSSAVVTGAFNFMGRATTTHNTSVLGNSPYTVLGATNTEIMNATTDVGSITKNGAALATAVKQIKIDGKAQLRNQMAVGSKFPVGIGTGRFELTGSFQAYFENFDLFDAFLNHDTIALGFTFNDSAGSHYEFTIPACKLTADPIHSKGVDTDIVEELTFSAQRDPVTSCMLQMDRFSSLLAI